MSTRHKTLGLLLRQGLLPNLIADTLDPYTLAEQARAVGLHCMEVSCRRPDTLQLLPKLKTAFPDMRFGVSSLVEDGPYYDFLQRRGPAFPSIRQAVDAGADFLVSVLAFSDRTYRRYPQLPIIPAVTSAQEAREQLDLGAALIKHCLTPGHEPAAVRATFHSGPIHFGIPLLLTGGVRPDLIDTYLGCGMLVAVAGFDLILQGQYEQQQAAADPATIRQALQAYVDAFAAARQAHLPGVDFAAADPLLIQQQSGRFMNVCA